MAVKRKKIILMVILALFMINLVSAVTMQQLGCSGMQIIEYSNGFLMASQLNCNYLGSCEKVNSYVSKGLVQVGTLNCLDKEGNPKTFMQGIDIGKELDKPKTKIYNIPIFNIKFSLINISLIGGITFVGIIIYIIKRKKK